MDDTFDEISVQELKDKIDSEDEQLYIADVREQDEWDIAHIKEAHLHPLSELEYDYENIPKDKHIAVYCKMGGRSFQAAQLLKSKGYENVLNVQGGIDAWAEQIDQSMPTY